MVPALSKSSNGNLSFLEVVGDPLIPGTSIFGDNVMAIIYFKNGGDLGFSGNTQRQYDKEVEFEYVISRLEVLGNMLANMEGRSVYLYSFNIRDKSKIRMLAKNSGLRFVGQNSGYPKKLRWLSLFFFNKACLWEVVDMNILASAFEQVSEWAMAGVWVFPEHYKQEFEKNVMQDDDKKSIDFGIKQFEDYFMYVVDTDNHEVESGMVEIVSYGSAADYLPPNF